ncbi:MAG: hypothetical protein BWY57_02348 [Betaproteobacteria bacterium ADurb.Bin341]|nr:MAG: hypothetical protein BWY57_02348 [Betaproteobacteria bacterium ADurb.Bin341]
MLNGALRFPAHRFNLRQFLLQFQQLLLIGGQFLTQKLQFVLLFSQRIRTGYRQRGNVVAQAFPTLRNSLQSPLGMALVSQFDLQALLTLRRARLQAIQFFFGLGMRFLDLRRQFHLRFQMRLGLLDPLAARFPQFFPTLAVGIVFSCQFPPVRQFAFQLCQPRFQRHQRFAAVAHFRFQAHHLGIGFIHLALRRMQAIARGKMRFACCFQLGFRVAQRSHLRFQLDAGTFDFLRQPPPLVVGFILLQ